jgi:hypothetical protein
MPTDEARIPTQRAERYLAQLASHTGHMQRGHFGGRRGHDGAHLAPGVQQVSQSGNRAVITFDWGVVCTAVAEPDALTLLLEAQNSADLERARDLLTRRVRTIGHREDLTVTWHPKDDAPS